MRLSKFIKRKTLMILGYGSASQYLLDKILQDQSLASNLDIIVVSRDEEKSLPRLELSKVAAALVDHHSEYPQNITFEEVDFFDEKSMVDILNKYSPDMVAYLGRFLSGHKYGSYSYPHGIGYGAWIPMSAAPVYAIMKAVRKSSADPIVVNTSLPDAVNPWLSTVGLTPTTGAGNVAHVVPRVKNAIVQYSHEVGDNLSYNDFDIELACSHYGNTKISKEGTDGGKPIHLKAFKDNGQVINYPQSEILRRSRDNSASGPARNIMIATDVYALVKAFLHDKALTKLHLPGVLGLVGGYPVLVNSIDRSFNILFDQNLATESQVAYLERVNSENLKGDGIEGFTEDGEVIFTDDLISKMKEVYKIDYPKRLSIEDAYDMAIVISDTLSNL